VIDLRMEHNHLSTCLGKNIQPIVKLRCTYISIPQVTETYECILSQPTWMWGAEMGVNEHNVAIGNEAVWTKEGDGPSSLLGMDLVRLGLERGKTAKLALEVIVKLLETHGQGGACSFTDGDWKYHNSFLLVDPTEAWVLETAGKWWVAERIKDGFRNISNTLSIHTKFDLQAKGIQDYARSKGFWDGKDAFDFAKAFTAEEASNHEEEESRESRIKKLLAHGTSSGRKVSPKTLMTILRDHEAGVCMHGAETTTASIITHFAASGPVHYVTVAPNPCESVFKPLRNVEISTLPLESWTETPKDSRLLSLARLGSSQDKEKKEKKASISRAEELLAARLAAEEGINESDNRDMLLVKLSRQLKALESKYLQTTDSGIDKKRVEPADFSSISSDKIFTSAVAEELEIYKKIIPTPSPSSETESTTTGGDESASTGTTTTTTVTASIAQI